MLRIYICPNCYNFRMVSRKPDAICFHCGTLLESCDVNYDTYMNMSELDRKELKERYKSKKETCKIDHNSIFIDTKDID